MRDSFLWKFAAPGLLLALAGLGACTYWSGDCERLVDQSGRDFALDPDRQWKDVSLEDIVTHPSSYVLMDVRFQAVMNRKDENIFMPFYTTFTPEDFTSFSVWPPSARLWEAKDRTATVPTLYMRKDNHTLQSMLSTERFSFVEIRGRVMGDYMLKPYIEVSYVDTILPPVYSEESLADVRGGLQAASDKKAAEAIHRLERALEFGIGKPGRIAAHFQLGRLYEERGDHERAARHYEAALWDDPDHVAAYEGWERCAKAIERKQQMPPK